MLRTESQRGQENGIEMTLRMHKHLDAESRAKLFAGNEALMIHGHTPEILNPKTTFKVTRDPDEAQELLDQGYEEAFDVGLDDMDPDQDTAKMYVLRGGGLNRYLTGAMSYTGMSAKGADKHGQYYNPQDQQGVANMQSMSAIASQARADVLNQFRPDVGFDPVIARKATNRMVPLLDGNGRLVDYRYVMSDEVRDTLLQRDNRFEHLLGTMAGSTFDKIESREQNRKVLEALREHYTSNFGDNPEGFIRIHHNSSDDRMRQIWDMLPEGTKKDVKSIWGNNGMWVPKSMVDVVFGYRKASLADAFDKENPDAVEKAVKGLVTNALYTYARAGKNMSQAKAHQYAKRGAVVLRRAESGWQEIVREAKDFIVVKTGTVLYGNIMSNLWLLSMKGVPVWKGLKDQHTALKGAMDYERDRSALAQLKAYVETGYQTQSMDEVQAEIIRLEDALKRNPVHDLIDSGLMPTIVEDITMEDNPYSYKSQLTHWADEKTAGLNEHVRGVGRFIYMSHDTSLYKFLSKTTQYSDFVARYALYQHLTTRKVNPLSKEDAIFEASESFVNYDIPLPKSIQYLDDMGLLPFIKYFLSIQRVLVKNFRDNPLRVLSTMSFNSMMGGLPMPTDSSFVTRIGNNPFSVGALSYPSAVTDAATIQSAMSLIK